MSVLITGASGLIGTMLRQGLGRYGWSLRYLDRVAPPAAEGAAPGLTVVGDIGDDDALDRAFAAGEDPVQAVVHLAGQPTEAPWPLVRAANIDGTYSVFEAARRHGVRRVVFASSNHAVGFTPRDAGELADAIAPRPDTLYGISKAFGEALARYYVDRYGFQVACLRIGSCNHAPSTRRELATWLSPDDVTGLVDAALRRSDLGFALVWGVSANRERWWSLDGNQALGFVPADDAATSHPRLLDLPPLPSDDYAGGPFTTQAYGIDPIRAGAAHKSPGFPDENADATP